ncbi:MAG TPA: gamma-glutamyl-gamma-aminobutyrate hydrolase family protein [Planctomycetota bacterium]|jgi:putative glutamine amidotransferase|nr:gamma-glutamyl-gamma-aminobutyrate hydrolase family protein [Planctomycetota bacterium]
MSGSRPLIGIDGVLSLAESPRLVLAARYADSILKAGGIPVAIPPVGGPSDIERLLDRLDGVLFSGGDDFDTERLSLGPVHPAATPVPTAKQDFDFELAHAVIAKRIPVLGICYGMQLLGLAEGAGLWQHLPDDRPGGAPHSGGVVHAVAIAPDSIVGRLLGESTVDVVSRHHQALARVAAPWRVSGTDPEGLIEAIERADHPFAVGVQWHPELAPEGSAHDRLFRGLVGAAALRARRQFATPTAPGAVRA